MNKLNGFKQTPASGGLDLRIDLAEIILGHLGEDGLTQLHLAELASVTPQQITRIIHSSTNCTFDTAGRILLRTEDEREARCCAGRERTPSQSNPKKKGRSARTDFGLRFAGLKLKIISGETRGPGSLTLLLSPSTIAPSASPRRDENDDAGFG